MLRNKFHCGTFSCEKVLICKQFFEGETWFLFCFSLANDNSQFFSVNKSLTLFNDRELNGIMALDNVDMKERMIYHHNRGT